ncbi:hypothetical protein D1F64_05775 [Breoghania sp. L-A4]|nr:hypothetical protein D1F64_05775 [Breoghania sp. L-A4]
MPKSQLKTPVPYSTAPVNPLKTKALAMAPAAVGVPETMPQAVAAVTLPLSMAAKQRNTALDWLFYDVGSLTTPEFDLLVRETNIEGSILVVRPRGNDDSTGIVKYEDYSALRAAPGKLLSRFSIAGVGSSDVGAAALARNLADHYGEPVGAIIAGYGAADLLGEALGGWFVLGAANSLLSLFNTATSANAQTAQRLLERQEVRSEVKAERAARRIASSPDSDALLQLLLDEERTIKTILGHSKGCLSIAFAMEALALLDLPERREAAGAIQLITTGAVVEFPGVSTTRPSSWAASTGSAV